MKIALWGDDSLTYFKDHFKDETGIEVFDFTQILKDISQVSQTLFIEICTNERLKLHLLSGIEQVYGNVALYNRVILTDEVIQGSGMPVLARPHDGTEPVHKYQSIDNLSICNKRFRHTNEQFAKASQIHFDPSDKKAVGYNHLCVFMMLLNLYKEEMNMPTIEESIRQAMEELGIGEQFEAKKPEAKKPEAKKPEAKKPEAKKPEAKKPTPEDEGFTEIVSEDVQEVLYCKVKDNKMALIIPVSLTPEHTTIAGMEVNVFSVSIPDLSVSSLQELLVLKDQKVSKETRNPAKGEPTSTKDKTKNIRQAIVHTPDTPDTPDMDLEALVREKKDITQRIAEARADGDAAMVESLRKQRRVVRNKINQLNN